MRLTTLRLADGRTAAARIEGELAIELPVSDVGALLRAPDRDALAASSGPAHLLAETERATLVPRPEKIVCVGLNYANHIREMGRELPEYPTLFTKFPDALLGPADDIALPPESDAVDWEAELVVVIGAEVRRADRATAQAAIAGFTVMNDITMRDWQYRTTQWFQGKAWEASTPVGPELITPDELPADAVMTCSIDGELVQRVPLADLVFDPADLVAYVSTMFTLRPGDLIATGTPGGVGHARSPQRYLRGGEELVTTITGIGELRNRIVAP